MTLFYEMAGLITARSYTGAALGLGLQLAAHAVQLAVLPRGAEGARVAALLSTFSLVKPTITLLTYKYRRLGFLFKSITRLSEVLSLSSDHFLRVFYIL